MANDRIKVPGYAKRIFYSDGIEYRNFSPDLVGLQLTSDGGTPLFTMGNFSITTNMEPKSDKTFITTNFSNFVTLTDLGVTLQQSLSLLEDNAIPYLNLDKTKLTNYALFGSLSEFVRVSLEEIIIKWPASIYLRPVAQPDPNQPTITGYTVQNYLYDNLTQTATFTVPTNLIDNKFQINYLVNGNLASTFNATNDLRDMVTNYASFAILNNGQEFNVLGFTGATTLYNDFIYFKVSGNPFSGQPSNSVVSYHVKPVKVLEDKFFNALPDFEAYLLNRLVSPIYTATFNYPIKSDNGVILYVTDSLTWPVSDGYNIDFDTADYTNYVSKLLEISVDSDSFSSNLMVRFLVTESISDFDTTPVHLSDLDKDTSGQKMNKTLHIYGRSYDDLNNYIKGIAFANSVSYNKQDNTPDVYLKNIAKVLGWDLVSSILEEDLLQRYVTPAPSTYSGQSVGLTLMEADYELWRRLILNTPWLWKSKGARKSIEFLFRFIGVPKGLINFNEYIYLADAPIDVEIFKKVLRLNGLEDDLLLYPIDSEGYPTPLPDTSDMYFQNDGLWYRETGGSASTMDILVGNNPHLGPYDGGYKYINQFRQLIKDFSAVTISSTTTTTGSTNLFTNYNLGLINGYSGATYVNAIANDGTDLSNCFIVKSDIVKDPNPKVEFNDCGCQNSDASDDLSLRVCVDINENFGSQTVQNCNDAIKSVSLATDNSGIFNFQYFQYNRDGSIYSLNGQPVTNNSIFASKICCTSNGGIPALYNQTTSTTTPTGTSLTLINTGYICCDNSGKCGCKIACKWKIAPQKTTTDGQYIVFVTETGQNRVTTPDGCNCVANLTTPVRITDPLTGEIGYGCRLTPSGTADINSTQSTSVLYNTYNGRYNGIISCTGVYSQPQCSSLYTFIPDNTGGYFAFYNTTTPLSQTCCNQINSTNPLVYWNSNVGRCEPNCPSEYNFLPLPNGNLEIVNVSNNQSLTEFCCNVISFSNVIYWDRGLNKCVRNLTP